MFELQTWNEHFRTSQIIRVSFLTQFSIVGLMRAGLLRASQYYTFVH